MSALTRFQIVWTETKDLQVPAGGDATTLARLRQQVAAIASEAEKSFSRFESVPAQDDDLYGADVAACTAAAEAAVPDALKNMRVILWPSADGKTLTKDEALPAPWDTATPDTMELIGRFTVDGHDVSAFSRAVRPNEDASRLVSLVTGTGLPPGTSVYVPREVRRKPVDTKAARVAFWLAVASVALFAMACLWSMSVGDVTRMAGNAFAARLATNVPAAAPAPAAPAAPAAGAPAAPAAAPAAVAAPSTPETKCSTQFDVRRPSTLFGAPQDWLPGTAGNDGVCLTDWLKVVSDVQNASNRDWWSRTKVWLAKWTVSDSGYAFSLRMPILLAMASIIMMALAAGLGVMGRPLGLFIDKRNRMSLTRVQFAIWLVILMGPLAAYALFNVGFWAESLDRIQQGAAYATNAAKQQPELKLWENKLSGLLDFTPSMETTLWALLGISGGTTILSSFITQPGPTSAAPGGATPVLPPRRTRILTKDDPKDAALADLVYGETEEDDGVVDSTRVQTIVITGVLAAIYVSLALEAAERIGGLSATGALAEARQVFSSMPPVSATFLWLLGLSHATLLGGKLVGAYKQ
ncbi:hypothetical protein [Bradyrhizobium guangdongense]|uniref:hypothetical protein n=1 Tax=Bradyrhizobium guangdongense TaxID=1325090 RepID=UPI00164313C8|nr:hypothetical protein [Bradyrhizobium guangdongense]